MYIIRDESGFEHDRTEKEKDAYKLRNEHDELYELTFYIHEE